MKFLKWTPLVIALISCAYYITTVYKYQKARDDREILYVAHEKVFNYYDSMFYVNINLRKNGLNRDTSDYYYKMCIKYKDSVQLEFYRYWNQLK